MNAEEAVGIAGIAKVLNCSTATAYRMARSGQIPGIRTGRKWAFFPSEVKAALAAPRDPWARSPQSRAAKRRAS